MTERVTSVIPVLTTKDAMMRWKSYNGPKSGEKRVHRYFALWPTQLNDGYTVWLQSYWAIETWVAWDDGTTDVGLGHWKTNSIYADHPDRPDTGSPT